MAIDGVLYRTDNAKTLCMLTTVYKMVLGWSELAPTSPVKSWPSHWKQRYELPLTGGDSSWSFSEWFWWNIHTICFRSNNGRRKTWYRNGEDVYRTHHWSMGEWGMEPPKSEILHDQDSLFVFWFFWFSMTSSRMPWLGNIVALDVVIWWWSDTFCMWECIVIWLRMFREEFLQISQKKGCSSGRLSDKRKIFMFLMQWCLWREPARWWYRAGAWMLDELRQVRYAKI